MIFNINIAVTAIFLLITVFVSLSSGDAVKNIKDYALGGGRNFNTATLTATIVAIWISGSFFSIAITETYEEASGFILGVV